MRSSHLWLLLTAAYGLVNSNAKWQYQSDNVFLDFGLKQSKHMPHLFYQREGGELVLVVAKVVDDLKATCKEDRATAFLEMFDKKFKLGTTNHGPGNLRFFGINAVQHEDCTVETHADDKMNAVIEYQIKRDCRKESELPMNEIEKSVFK